jgi:hypothetical protein
MEILPHLALDVNNIEHFGHLVNVLATSKIAARSRRN